MGSNSSVGSFHNHVGQDNTSKVMNDNNRSYPDNISERSTFSRGDRNSKLPRLHFNRSNGKSGSLLMPEMTKTNSSPPRSSRNQEIKEDGEKGVRQLVKQKTNNAEEISSALQQQSPIYEKKSSFKNREMMFNSISGDKKSTVKQADVLASDPSQSLPQPSQRNAVSFVDRPKLSKTKSVRQKGLLFQISPNKSKDLCNDQDDDFARDSDDSDDYDGVPRTEEVQLLAPADLGDKVSDQEDKMEVTLDPVSVCSADEPHNDIPQTLTVDDSTLVTPLLPLKGLAKLDGHRTLPMRRTKDFSEMQDFQHYQAPGDKPISLVARGQVILESIEESPGSRAKNYVEESKETTFENLMIAQIADRQPSPNHEMVEDDEEDGLPKTQEDSAIMVKQNSGELQQKDMSPVEPQNTTFGRLMAKQNSKSRSFAEPQAARQSIKLFNSSFGKEAKGKHNNSFLSVSNPKQPREANKLSARSGGSAGGRGLRLFGKSEVHSQVSESHSFVSHVDQNEVDLELIEQMQQSQSQGLMDECTHIERISGNPLNDLTQKVKHAFTPVSYRHDQMGVSAGKSPINQSFLGEFSAQMSSHARSQLRMLFDGSQSKQYLNVPSRHQSNFHLSTPGALGHSSNNQMFTPSGGYDYPMIPVPDRRMGQHGQDIRQNSDLSQPSPRFSEAMSLSIDDWKSSDVQLRLKQEPQIELAASELNFVSLAPQVQPRQAPDDCEMMVCDSQPSPLVFNATPSNVSPSGSSLPMDRWLGNTKTSNSFQQSPSLQAKNANICNSNNDGLPVDKTSPAGQLNMNRAESAGVPGGFPPMATMTKSSSSKPQIYHHPSFGSPEHLQQQLHERAGQLGRVQEEDANTLTSKEESMSDSESTPVNLMPWQAAVQSNDQIRREMSFSERNLPGK